MIIKSYVPFMERVFELAKIAEEKGDVPIGAVVVFDNKIIAEGYNMVESMNLPTAHAEMLALSAAAKIMNNDLSECTLITNLEPCGMCSGAIANYRVGRVVFGAYDEQFGCLFSKIDLPKIMGKPIKTVGGIMEKECSTMLNDFFHKLRS